VNFKARDRANLYLKEMEGFVKNIGLAFTYVATLHLSMYTAGLMDDALTAGTLAGGIVAGTVRNVYKKTFLIRALHRWTHKKYRTDPKNAEKYARINA